ncbi:Crp/Fnr family transcriptional regulator [Tenacibaculum sp. 190524A05c]|uniref:Crp/Fnr family transcriptional regulator n=1 Tax=Tenacibaculum platacis TaxID=3137852 RepID=UPI0032B3097D
MTKLFSTLANYNIHFTDKEKLLLQNELQYVKIEKDEFILKEGEVNSEVFFLNYGSFYQYAVDHNQDVNVIDLYTESDWMLNHKSFTTRKPSKYAIQACEESFVYKLSIDSIHKLIAISQEFFKIGKLLDQAVSRIEFYDNNNSPDEKYIHLLENKPIVIRKFPQKVIASYLKITPETLSRVRKRIS